MKKYILAGPTISSSTPIHIGMYGDSASAAISRTIPIEKAHIIACPAIFFNRRSSPAPLALAARASIATAKAPGIACISQPMVVVALTAAVASSPRCPTIAVSTYWRRVASISSKTVGIERLTSEAIVAL